MEIIVQVIVILGFLGGLVGVYVKLSDRVTIVETKMNNKVDKDALKDELYGKIDDVRKVLEEKMEKGFEKLERRLDTMAEKV